MAEAKLARRPGVPVVITDGLTEGRIVHFVMADKNAPCRAAMIVRVARLRGPDIEAGRDEENKPIVRATFTLPDSGNCNLTVFTDWTNDQPLLPAPTGTIHKTAVVYHPFPGNPLDEPELGTWHFVQEHV